MDASRVLCGPGGRPAPAGRSPGSDCLWQDERTSVSVLELLPDTRGAELGCFFSTHCTGFTWQSAFGENALCFGPNLQLMKPCGCMVLFPQLPQVWVPGAPRSAWPGCGFARAPS